MMPKKECSVKVIIHFPDRPKEEVIEGIRSAAVEFVRKREGKR